MHKGILCMIVVVTVLLSLSPVQVNAAPPPGLAECTLSSLWPFWICTIKFVQGWNLISLPVVPVANATFPNTPDGIFGSDVNQGSLRNVTSIYTYTIVKGKGTWQTCAVRKTGLGALAKYTCTGTLKNMVDGNGYWVSANAGFTLNVATNAHPTYGGLVGAVIPPAAAPHAYSLIAGWNLVGYKPQPDPTKNATIAACLSSASPNYDQNNVWIYTPPQGTWDRTSPSTISTMEVAPGQAMWVYMNSADVLYP
jgi:hypothetical protein